MAKLEETYLPTEVEFFGLTKSNRLEDCRWRNGRQTSSTGGRDGLPATRFMGKDAMNAMRRMFSVWRGWMLIVIFSGMTHLAVAAVTNIPPLVVLSLSTNRVSTNVPVHFSSVGSFDPEGNALARLWDFGDGAASTLANPSHSYATAGAFTVVLMVSDGVNVVRTQAMITVTAPMPLTIVRSGTNFVITWSTGSLQQADSPLGPYADVVGAVSPYTVPVSAGLKFYRTR